MALVCIFFWRNQWNFHYNTNEKKYFHRQNLLFESGFNSVCKSTSTSSQRKLLVASSNSTCHHCNDGRGHTAQQGGWVVGSNHHPPPHLPARLPPSLNKPQQTATSRNKPQQGGLLRTAAHRQGGRPVQVRSQRNKPQQAVINVALLVASQRAATSCYKP